MRRSSGALFCLLVALAALLAPAAGADTTTPDDFRAPLATPLASLTSGPPISIGTPTAGGTLVQGQTLTASSGSWNPSATSVTYQWQRDGGSGFADITGETAPTHVLAAADVGKTLRVHVVATNASGTGTADSAATGTVIAGDPANSSAPVVTGNLRGGSTLTVSAGAWFPSPTSYTYKWQRDTGSGFADISGATASTYTTVPADVAASLRVRVTGTNSYSSVTVSSNTVGAITSGKPVSSVAPVISGTAKRNIPLSVNAGSWDPAPTSYAYQWQRDAGSGYVDITGETTTSYTPGGADIGHPLRVIVTGTNSFGSTAATSVVTANVATDPPVNVGTPSISGTAKRTFALTASAGSWTPAGATFAYQWQRDSGSGFGDITGATAAAYTLVTADVGAVVRVKVTATNVDGNASAFSAQTVTVVAATPGSSMAPTITQVSRVGDVATTSDGSWNPAAASYAYQWQRKVGGVWTDISGATTKTYTLVTADAGSTIRSKVTATNTDGTGVGYSGPSPTVVSPPVAPTTIAAPAGTLTDTGTLTIAAGVWTPSSTTFSYQWLRCPSGATTIGGCVTIGAGQAYTLIGPDVGHTIVVRVTGTSGGVSTVATSTFTSDVAGRALTVATAPSISGTVQVASVVSAVPALWSVPTLTERWQWRRCAAAGTGCVDIAGASRPDYTIAVADKGGSLVLHETVMSWGRTATADSTFAVVADQPVPAATIAPIVTGTAKRTGNLQVSQGSWTNNPKTYTYSWQRCAADGTACVAIAGETHPNHILVAADTGHAIRGVVTATNTEGSVSAASAPTAVVAAVLPSLLTIGPITGIMQVPQTLQAFRSTWDTTPDTRYAYQWQRCDAGGANCADIVGARSQSYRLQTADARKRLRVVHVATNPDGSTTAATPVTAAILPAPPGVAVTPRLSLVGRPDVGKTATLTPGTWSAATEITTKTLQFWRCAPTCVSLSTGGAGSYVLVDADAGALIRGSETAVGPGGTIVSWAAAWLGPVRSTSVATSSLASSGGSASLTTSRGVVLARASVASAASAARAARASGVAASRSVRITVRRAAGAAGRLRAWACPVKPVGTDKTPCTKATWLTTKRAAKLTLTVPKGQRVRVVVVRKKK